MPGLRVAVWFALAAALGGCAGGVRVGYSDQNSVYYPELVKYASPQGEITTTILGDPFGGNADAEAIARAIPAPGFAGPTRFTTRPGPGTPSNYRLVLIFNPASAAYTPDSICRSEPGLAGRPGGADAPIRVQATFCADKLWASQLTAVGQAAAGPDDPAFRALMDQIVANLLPSRRRDEGDSATFPGS